MDKRFWSILAAIVLVFVGVLWFSNHKKAGAPSSDASQLTNHVEGAGKKNVTLVEYGDYQCPACLQYYQPLKDIFAKYSNDIVFQFRNFPLTTKHPNAFAAARAAEAAGLQNKYWQMHDLLYDNQDPNGVSGWIVSRDPLNQYFVGYARQLGLNIDQFKQEFASDKVNGLVNADLNEGGRLGIDATPTFYLNGAKMDSPAPTVDAFSQAIDAAIAAKNTKQ